MSVEEIIAAAFEQEKFVNLRFTETCRANIFITYCNLIKTLPFALIGFREKLSFLDRKINLIISSSWAQKLQNSQLILWAYGGSHRKAHFYNALTSEIFIISEQHIIISKQNFLAIH